MNICMVGAGYVGLVSGAGFAEMGNRVVCADVDRAKVAMLRDGKIPIVEPGLDDLVNRNRAAGRLSFTNEIGPAISDSELVFVAVGTPGLCDGSLDTAALDSVARLVAKSVRKESVLVLKSTVPPGTNHRLRSITADARHPVHIVSNPEFLKEGDAIEDFLRPDRIIIGCDPDDLVARNLMRQLYQPLCQEKDRILWMDPVSAELSKYVCNALLAMRISFMNEIAGLCERLDADIHRVRLGAGSDHRIGSKFLYAGAGYGGSCFPKDVRALVHAGLQQGLELSLVQATDKVNQRQKAVVLDKVRRSLDGHSKDRTVAIWGLSFKPRTDDIREAPAIALIESLLAEGAKIAAHDPSRPRSVLSRFGDRIRLASDPYEAAEGADALVLMTEWQEYHSPDFDRLRTIMRRPVLVDGRNIWTSYCLHEQGFTYIGIGVRGAET